MEKEHEKYTSLVNKLKKVHPVLNHPEELTDSIMNSLKKRKTSKTERVIIQARPWLTMAAVFLIGLYIFQEMDVPVKEKTLTNIPSKKPDISLNDCLASYFLNRNSDEGFFDSYFCYLKQTELENRKSLKLIMKLQNNL